jgi:hypothetical protein
MLFEDVRTNYTELSPEARLEFIRNYRIRRIIDLAKPSTYNVKKKTTGGKKTAKKKKGKQVKVTNTQLDMMKKLGLI